MLGYTQEHPSGQEELKFIFWLLKNNSPIDQNY